MRAGRCFLEKHSWKGAEFSLSPRMAPSVPHTAPRKALYRCGVGDGADQTGGPAGPGPPNAICSLADTRGFPAGRQRTAHRTQGPGHGSSAQSTHRPRTHLCGAGAPVAGVAAGGGWQPPCALCLGALCKPSHEDAGLAGVGALPVPVTRRSHADPVQTSQRTKLSFRESPVTEGRPRGWTPTQSALSPRGTDRHEGDARSRRRPDRPSVARAWAARPRVPSHRSSRSARQGGRCVSNVPAGVS